MDLHRNTFRLEVEKTFFLICAWTQAQPYSHSNL